MEAKRIGWGTLGTIWGPATKGRSIVTIFLRENRYTLEYIRINDTFSVSFFPEEYRKALGLLGRVSGRDDPQKIKHAGLTAENIGSSVSFREASKIFICRKLFIQKMDADNILPEIREKMYANQPEHVMVIGEIEQYIDRGE
jgi:flavin reductase (DIM6/NTAB) family NADH-FMN oxidoreductase RutF